MKNNMEVILVITIHCTEKIKENQQVMKNIINTTKKNLHITAIKTIYNWNVQ
jgi:hypothetical protein